MNAGADPTTIVLTSAFATAALVFLGATPVFAMRRARRCSIAEQEVGPPPLPYGKVAVRFYEAFDILPAAMIYALLSALVISSMNGTASTSRLLTPTDLVLNIGLQVMISGMVLVYMTRRTSASEWLGLCWPSWPNVFFVAPVSVFAMWLIFGVLQACGYFKWMESLGAETVQESVKLLQTTEDPMVLGLMGFAAVVVAPLCEELLFRGFLYPVAKKFTGPWLAAFSSALFFASAHGNLSALLPLFILGLLLVLIYEKTGSLWAPIAVHFCFNSATVIVQIAARWLNIPLEASP
jgi:membrane protease YdiL (CAAX protease family)